MKESYMTHKENGQPDFLFLINAEIEKVEGPSEEEMAAAEAEEKNEVIAEDEDISDEDDEE